MTPGQVFRRYITATTRNVNAIVAHNIRAVRLSRGMAQRELAAGTKLTLFAISHFERGHKTPRLETLWRIAEALRVPASSLLEPPAPHVDTVASDIGRHLNCLGHHVEETRSVNSAVTTLLVRDARVAILPSHCLMFEDSAEHYAATIDTLLRARWSAVALLHNGRIDLQAVGRAINLWVLASRAKSLGGRYIVLKPNGTIRQDGNRKLRYLSTDARMSTIPGQAA